MHSTIKAKPTDIYNLEDTNTQKYKFIDFETTEGDQVRTLDKNAFFEKGTYKYSDTVYTIMEKKGQKVQTRWSKQIVHGVWATISQWCRPNPTGYDQVINDANVEEELKEAEKDRVEGATTRDSGKAEDRAPATRTRSRDIKDAPSEGEYINDKNIKTSLR